MEVKKDLFYSNDHEWVRVEGEKAYIGITDYAQHSLGEIVYVELPEVDNELNAGEVFGVIESVKAASDSLSDSPQLINEDPYASWVVLIEMSDKSELDNLMNAQEYEEFCSKED